MVLVLHAVLGGMLRLESPVRIVKLVNRQTARQSRPFVYIAHMENMLNPPVLQAAAAAQLVLHRHLVQLMYPHVHHVMRV